MKNYIYLEGNQRLPFVLNSIGCSYSQKPLDRPNGMNQHQIIWVESGSGVFNAGGETAVLSAGEGLFTRACVPHSYSGDALITSWCTFSCSDDFIDYCIGKQKQLFFKAPSFLNKETKNLVDFAKGSSSSLALSAAGYSYIVKFFEAIMKPSNTVLSRAREYMEQNCNRQITLNDIAKHLGTNRFVLCRFYKNNCTLSVMDELKNIRISKAKRMLSFTSQSIEEIAKECGFISPSYFSKTFREECGVTPSSYRKIGRG